jgi:hypothetical protein
MENLAQKQDNILAQLGPKYKKIGQINGYDLYQFTWGGENKVQCVPKGGEPDCLKLSFSKLSMALAYVGL